MHRRESLSLVLVQRRNVTIFIHYFVFYIRIEYNENEGIRWSNTILIK